MANRKRQPVRKLAPLLAAIALACAGVATASAQSQPWQQEFLHKIADPNIGFVLLVVGILGMYVEFTSPGLVAPGVIGAVLALLGLRSLSALPLNWLGATLLVLALALLMLEAKFTSHGILGVTGAVTMVLGAMMLVSGPPDQRIHFTTALLVTIPFALITVFLVSLAVKARSNKVITGVSTMIEEIGVARTPLAPEGEILIRGEYWKALSSAPVPQGSTVRVTAIDGLTLKVEPWPV